MSRSRTRLAVFLVGGLLVSLFLAGVVSNFASGSPDGLDAATLDGCTTNADGEITGGDCPARRAGDHELGDSPLADYAVNGIDNEFLATGLSGIIGVAIVFGVGGLLFWLVRRPGRAEAGRAGAGAGRAESRAESGRAESGDGPAEPSARTHAGS